jgi:hypothetical protein
MASVWQSRRDCRGAAGIGVRTSTPLYDTATPPASSLRMDRIVERTAEHFGTAPHNYGRDWLARVAPNAGRATRSRHGPLGVRGGPRLDYGLSTASWSRARTGVKRG